MHFLPLLARFRAAFGLCAAALLLATLAACGGGGGGSTSSAMTPTFTPPTPTAPNELPIVVDRGTDGSAINSPFVTITVCVPGTQTCQTIDHVVVDTGSYGLRIAASALIGLSLPAVAAPSGQPLGECAAFASGYAWGPVRRADIEMSSETAFAVPVQVVNDSTFAAVPGTCSSTGANMGVGAGAKAIVGLGFLKTDCGTFCANSAAAEMYFSCASGNCTSTQAPETSQVANPVALFATDNNGVAITLPSVPVGGTPALQGSLVFGIGTQSNNQIASTPVYTADAQGNIQTSYKGSNLSAFLDSGSNGIFFHDSSLPCSTNFYCPVTLVTESAQVTGANGTSNNINFAVESPSSLVSGAVAGHLAGDIGLSQQFDWGLPFFFGRTVFVALDGATTSAGPGPYWAFNATTQ